jgi:predicted dinucleotide-binding enzyme
MRRRTEGVATWVRIGIVGSGNIGATTASLFSAAGHDVAISNSRGPESLADLVGELGNGVRAASVEDAVAWGDVVLLAVPWTARGGLPPAEAFAAKIVIDATNAFGPGGAIDLEPRTSSEEVLAAMPGARFVKAFNTMNFRPLGQRGHETPPLALFLAGDDAGAKETVAALIGEVGFDPIDTGSLREGGRRQQPGSPLFNVPMTGDEGRALL